MAGENGQTLEKWLASFDTVTQDVLCVLAPSLCGFVIWVLQRAMAEGRKRLYFMARDGYLMYCLAEIFCRTLGLDVECRYLYCSRYSLRIPAFHLDMDGALEFICRGGIDVTTDKILNRSGLAGKEKKKVLRLLCLPYAADEVIPYSELAEVRSRLAGCDYFLGCVERNSRRRMPELLGYLEQEGLLAGQEDGAAGGKAVGNVDVGNSEKAGKEACGCAYALVDSGWTGSIQKTLGEVLAGQGGKAPLKGYYFGLYELPDGVRREDYETYYFGPGNGLRTKVYFSNCLFESVFSAPHGMTVGYRGNMSETGPGRGSERRPAGRKETGAAGATRAWGPERDGCAGGQGRTYEPVLAGCTRERREFAERMELCVSVYGERLAHNIRTREAFLSLDVRECREATRRLFKDFMGRPTKAEAETFGDLRFSDDVLENALYKTAAELSEEELKQGHVWNKALVMLGVRGGFVKESAWYEGSAARAGRHRRYHWKMYAAYKYLLYMRQMGWKGKRIGWRK